MIESELQQRHPHHVEHSFQNPGGFEGSSWQYYKVICTVQPEKGDDNPPTLGCPDYQSFYHARIEYGKASRALEDLHIHEIGCRSPGITT